MSVFINLFDGNRKCFDIEFLDYDPSRLHDVIVEKYPGQELQLFHNGRLVQDNECLQKDGTYYALLGLKGGKGGFGAMLRMIGAQIEKTTNREACRDLSGRRMRDVNNEKHLKSWIEKKKQLEEERVRKRREKLERMRSRPKHFFVDPSYDKQKEDVTESLEEAVSTGINVAGPSGSSSSGAVKRKADSDSDSDEDDADFKKHCMWLGVNEEEDEEETEGEVIMVHGEQGEESREDITEESATASSSSSSSSSTSPESGLDVQGEAIDQPSSSSSDKLSLLDVLPPPSSGKPSSDSAEQESINLDDYSSPAELEECGLDRLKSALMERGMKCGGTLEERAQRLFSVKGLEPGQINPALLAKPSKGKKGKKK